MELLICPSFFPAMCTLYFIVSLRESTCDLSSSFVMRIDWSVKTLWNMNVIQLFGESVVCAQTSNEQNVSSISDNSKLTIKVYLILKKYFSLGKLHTTIANDDIWYRYIHCSVLQSNVRRNIKQTTIRNNRR